MYCEVNGIVRNQSERHHRRAMGRACWPEERQTGEAFPQVAGTAPPLKASEDKVDPLYVIVI